MVLYVCICIDVDHVVEVHVYSEFCKDVMANKEVMYQHSEHWSLLLRTQSRADFLHFLSALPFVEYVLCGWEWDGQL